MTPLALALLADVGSNTEATIAAVCGVAVALAVPLNTWLTLRMLRRQKEGNHHTETIRKLASALSDSPVDMPPEEVGERVAEALAEHDHGPATKPPTSP